MCEETSEKLGALFVTVVLLTVSLIVVSSPPTEPSAEAHFVFAAWDFPADEYGQGIDGFYIYENSTGSWKHIDHPWYGFYDYEHSGIFNWTAGVAIKLGCFTWFNSTVTEANDTAEGMNLQRHSVTVTDINVATVVFSQENFTYMYNYTYADPMWYYEYEVVLDFIPLAGTSYSVVVTYEVYYPIYP